jgi:uncharacterized membrane protein
MTEPRSLESSVGRLLSIGTYASVAAIAIGTVLLLASGASPLDPSPSFDLSAIPADLVALRPSGFLWLGIVAVIATPAGRVIAAMVGYWRRGEREMVIISALILGVIAIGVAVGVVAA